MKKTTAFLVVALLQALVLIQPAGAAESIADDTLYARIGGEAKLERIADRLIDESAQDPKTSRTFQQKVNIKRLKALLTEQLIALSGGPKPYTGENMKVSHAGMGLSEAEFYGMVEHLRSILDSEGVGEREKNELLRLLAPMKRDIVEAPTKPVAKTAE
ncbi:MAG TPA: group 1 truncated hemoglobin [Rhodocyclaceae bacterium]|nr:group 1 truncated hemoglobin [Rhodocyclaceae bacterium]